MIGFPFVAFLPRYATEILDVGSSGYGLLAAASAVGAVIVSMYIAGRGTGRAAWRIQAVSGLSFGAMLIVLSCCPVVRHGRCSRSPRSERRRPVSRR